MNHEAVAASTMTTGQNLLVLLVVAAGVFLIVVRIRKLRWRDPQRLFTVPQKKELFRQSGGRCENKPPLWFRCSADGEHADHIQPWSKGGPTTLANGQLLCRSHNLRKSNWVPSPIYRWRLMQRRKRY